ncbi:MAG: hypothetical protein KDE47_17285 [Caldilineaceae bacterium]|nr:hypothetical protein [Caldilineaceae bacterium]
MIKQILLETYLEERDLQLPVRVLASGYAPLAFVLHHVLFLLAPLALILGLPSDLFERSDPAFGQQNGKHEKRECSYLRPKANPALGDHEGEPL